MFETMKALVIKKNFESHHQCHLPQLKRNTSTYRALSSARLWRDLVNARELKIRQLCLLGFSHT